MAVFLLRWQVCRRFISEDVRKGLYIRCLNREFDQVLSEIRGIPKQEMDYGFLQLYLAKSCQWGHIESVDYLWHKYVLSNHVLVIRPHILCAMSSLALANDKHFIPEQIYQYFIELYGNDTNEDVYLQWKYELLRLKIESFASGTADKTSFSEKWKVLLQDMDQILPISTHFHVRDFPYLIRSVRKDISQDTLVKMLFSQLSINIKNPSTLPLLLNIILLQPQFTKTFKLNLFKNFIETHSQMQYDDSLMILFKLLQQDGYNLSQLIDIMTKQFNNKTELLLSNVTSRLLIEGIRDTEYHYRLQEFPQLSQLSKALTSKNNQI